MKLIIFRVENDGSSAEKNQNPPIELVSQHKFGIDGKRELNEKENALALILMLYCRLSTGTIDEFLKLMDLGEHDNWVYKIRQVIETELPEVANKIL